MSTDELMLVPRKWVEGYEDMLENCGYRKEAQEVRAALTTPVAERQPEGKRERFEKWVMATKHPVFGFLDGRSLARGDDRTGYADEYVQGLWVAYKKFTAPPELAELQSTIARLTAENDEPEWHQMMTKLEDQNTELRAEIERLKGGQDEPVLWFRPLIGAECNPNGQTYSVIFCEVPGHTPLYASPSAPVSVVLPEREHVHSKTLPFRAAAIADGYISGWNACLDKVKELNL